MKLTIKCDCGNYMEVEPETFGMIAPFEHELIKHDFYIGDQKHDIELLQDSVDDPDDVEATITELRIDCRRCGGYMILNCK